VKLTMIDAITHYHCSCRDLIYSWFTILIRERRGPIIRLLELHCCRQHLISVIDG
jgi:hypothetical protein